MFDRLCIGDAAKRLGVSPDTVRRKIKSREIDANRDNTGRWWVLLPRSDDTVTNAIASALPMQPQTLGKTDGLPNPMQDLHKAYTEALNRMERQHAAATATLRADMEAERQRHAAELERLSQAHKSAATALMDRVAGLLVERRERRAPWWARLFDR